MTASLKGFKELDETLGRLPKATAKRVLRKVGIDALKPLAEAMRANAPVKFGDLKASFTAGTALSRSQRKYAGFMGGGRNAGMLVIHAGPGSMPQAITQEFGTFKEPAQPSVTPAWEAGKDALLDRVAKGMAEPIMAAARKAAKKGTLRGG